MYSSLPIKTAMKYISIFIFLINNIIKLFKYQFTYFSLINLLNLIMYIILNIF